MTPEIIRKKAENKYLMVLKARGDSGLFPLILPGTGIGPSVPLLKRLSAIKTLSSGAASAGKKGYSLKLVTRGTRSEGPQTYVKHVYFESAPDYLAFLGKTKEFSQFIEDSTVLQKEFPELEEWVTASPREVIKQAGFWPDIIQVLRYFRDRETEGLYLREVPLRVSTKFMENREALLRNLLDRIMPEDRINQDEQDLSLRYGLKKDSDFRFRLQTDPADALFIPFTDLAVLPGELELWNPPCEKILIIENKMSFLTFPSVPGVLKIWGAGKSVVLLKNCRYLAAKTVIYWGDMDPQGFEILSLVRDFLPECRSLCMNRKAFESAREFAHKASLFHAYENLNLTEEEYELYHYLVETPEKSRVEQERLVPEFVRKEFMLLSLYNN